MASGVSRKTLSAEVFQEIVNSLKSDGGRRFNEQRSMPRVGLRGRVTIIPILMNEDDAKPIEVGVRDISANGIGLLIRKSFTPGTRFIVQFNRTNDTHLCVTYSVAHSKRVAGGLFLIGA